MTENTKDQELSTQVEGNVFAPMVLPSDTIAALKSAGVELVEAIPRSAKYQDSVVVQPMATKEQLEALNNSLKDLMGTRFKLQTVPGKDHEQDPSS